MGFGGGNDLGFGVAIMLDNQYSATAKVVAQSHTDMVYTIERGMEDLSRRATSTDDILIQNAQKIQQSGQMISTGLQLVGAGTALLAPVGIGLKYAAEFELAEAGLTTLLKSTEKAKEVMANVKVDASNSTMFGFQELLRGNQLLISTGISAERARKDINSLSDAVAATGGGNAELMRMSVNLQQIRSAGKATALDIKQFAYAGIDIYGLLSDSLGVSTKQVKELDITYDMLTDALAKANAEGGRFEGASIRMSGTLAGKWAAFKDQMIFAFAEIGMAVKPFVVPIIDFITMLAKGMALLAQTVVGKVILGVVVVTGLLLIAMGGLVTVMGLARGAAARLSTSLIQVGMVEVGTLFTTGGLTAGFYALAVAVWTAMAPLLPFIAIGAAIVAVGWAISTMLDSANPKIVAIGTVIGLALGPMTQLIVAYKYISRGIEEFKGIMTGEVDAKGGIIGFMQKVGGTFIAIGEIFNSWNGKTFELSETLHDALDKIGILEFVLALGTWVVRIKEFMAGFVSPFVSAYESIKSIAFGIRDVLQPVLEPVERWGQVIAKLTGATSLWNSAGKVMGQIFMAMAFPIITVIQLIAQLIESGAGIGDLFSGPIGWAMGLFGGGDAEGGDPDSPKNNAGKVSANTKTGAGGIGQVPQMKNSIYASTAAGGNNQNTTNTKNVVQDMTIVLEMDGDVLHKKLMKIGNEEDSRN